MPGRLASPVRWSAAVAAACLAGCAGAPAVGPAPREDLITPVVRGAEAGLEARLWVVQNQAGALAGAFRRFGPPAGAGVGEVETWRRNGFRVLEVPLGDLGEALAGLTTIGPRHREWLGLLPEWVEVVRGGQLAADQRVRTDGGAAQLGAGVLRLTARCWATPRLAGDGEEAGAVLRVEVMPELLAQTRDASAMERLLDPGDAPRTGVRGMAFERLRLGVTADGGSALVVVPESPEFDWDAAAEGRPETGGDAARTAVIGPRMPELPTLGELMLTSLASPESSGDARVVVVLVPRVPERFNLLPR